jgi:hypothetical protein
MDLQLKQIQILKFYWNYISYLVKMLHRLNGMFAFAIWDKLEKNWPLLRTEWELSHFIILFIVLFIFFLWTKALFLQIHLK